MLPVLCTGCTWIICLHKVTVVSVAVHWYLASSQLSEGQTLQRLLIFITTSILVNTWERKQKVKWQAFKIWPLQNFNKKLIPEWCHHFIQGSQVMSLLCMVIPRDLLSFFGNPDPSHEFVCSIAMVLAMVFVGSGLLEYYNYSYPMLCTDHCLYGSSFHENFQVPL